MRIILLCEVNKFEFSGGGVFSLNFTLFIPAKDNGRSLNPYMVDCFIDTVFLSILKACLFGMVLFFLSTSKFDKRNLLQNI